jgi:NAD(P)-dependent dehydrogenase (short-subunit alcohol dehydrogenase family)
LSDIAGRIPQRTSQRSVVVLGGYGNFGSRVAAALASDRSYRVFIAGRDLRKATVVAQEMGGSAEPLALDHHVADFAAQLRHIGANVVIHTAGPFQAQSYSVPSACIEARAHYVDIADGRAYVCGIAQLDAAAKRNDTLIVSGASSLPALSAAVIDSLSSRFSRVYSIEHGISAGAKPPGLATMEGVLSYVGKPFTRWENGAWKIVHGWQDMIVRRYPNPVDLRWLASCDVPDLQLFPQRYAPVKSVVFRAGVGFASTMLVTWMASWLVRARLMKSLVPYARPLHSIAGTLQPYGTKWSAMHVTLRGLGHDNKPAACTWTLLAGQDHGPNIPCFPAIALARKLLRDEVTARGAMPCMGLLSVDEILQAIPGLDLASRIE